VRTTTSDTNVLARTFQVVSHTAALRVVKTVTRLIEFRTACGPGQGWDGGGEAICQGGLFTCLVQCSGGSQGVADKAGGDEGEVGVCPPGGAKILPHPE
jgi:hypothetical protein